MKSMKSRTSKSIPTAPPADLLVCFPARAHLTLLPKPVSSPARAPAESHRRYQKKLSPVGAAQASPLLWAKEMASEPTSPKVTCAGQIKIRPNSHRHRSTKNWQSVMDEMERIHKKKKKLPSWGNRNQNQNPNPLGFKREAVNFLSCLRGFRFDFRCFRGFPQSETTSEEEEEEENEPAEASRRTMFPEWFMILHGKEETKPRNKIVSSLDLQPSSVPPPNALLLMRCRSAPSVSRIKRKPKQEQEDNEEEEKQSKISLKLSMEEEKEVISKKEGLVVMDYDADFYRLSSDIAKETWVVSGSSKFSDNPLLRSRSWKR